MNSDIYGEKGREALFRVVDGGREMSGAITTDVKLMVQREGNRRLAEAGVNNYVARELATGKPLPDAIKAFKLQIAFAVEALSHLSPLPADYRTDGYWPSL